METDPVAFVILSTLQTKMCQESRPSLLCHSERSEGSRSSRIIFGVQILRFAQNDKLLVGSRYQASSLLLHSFYT
jgi:hypothetical protein